MYQQRSEQHAVTTVIAIVKEFGFKHCNRSHRYKTWSNTSTNLNEMSLSPIKTARATTASESTANLPMSETLALALSLAHKQNHSCQISPPTVWTAFYNNTIPVVCFFLRGFVFFFYVLFKYYMYLYWLHIFSIMYRPISTIFN